MHDWKEIRKRYGNLVFAAAYRILRRHDQALDCFQDVFLELIEQNWKGPVNNWSAFLRWIAVKRALDRLRKERRIADRVESYNDAEVVLTTTQNPGSQLEFDELVERIRFEVARLPNRQGEAFWLRCIEQLDVSDVAEQLDTDANSVGVLIHRARSRLRELLADLNPARLVK